VKGKETNASAGSKHYKGAHPTQRTIRSIRCNLEQEGNPADFRGEVKSKKFVRGFQHCWGMNKKSQRPALLSRMKP